MNVLRKATISAIVSFNWLAGEPVSGRSALGMQPETTGLRSTVGFRLPRRLHDKGRHHA